MSLHKPLVTLYTMHLACQHRLSNMMDLRSWNDYNHYSFFSFNLFQCNLQSMEQKDPDVKMNSNSTRSKNSANWSSSSNTIYLLFIWRPTYNTLKWVQMILIRRHRNLSFGCPIDQSFPATPFAIQKIETGKATTKLFTNSSILFVVHAKKCFTYQKLLQLSKHIIKAWGIKIGNIS